MEIRIFVTVLNGLFIMLGSYIMAHTYLFSVDRTWSNSFWLNGFWWYLTWPTLNIIAIWWRTQSRAQRRRIILPTIVTIGNGLILMLSLVGFLSRFSPESVERELWMIYCCLGFIWSILNVLAIWWGRRTLKYGIVLILPLSTFAGLLAGWFVAGLFTFADFRYQTRGPAVTLGYNVGLKVFFIVLAVSAFVNRKK